MATTTSTTMSINVSRDGKETLSAQLRDRLGVEEGGEIVLVDAEDGVLPMTKRGFIDYALDRPSAKGFPTTSRSRTSSSRGASCAKS